MNDAQIEAAVKKFGTPLFMVDSHNVAAELDRMRSEFQKVYERSKVAYSVKTNYLPLLIEQAHQAGHMIEVVSRHEWEYVRRLGVADSNIIFNGPVKFRDDLESALDAGVILNVDSREELDTVDGIARTRQEKVSVGVRISPVLPNGRQSRFGIHPNEFIAWMEDVNRPENLEIRGLHLHYSMDRAAPSYGERVRFLSEIAHTARIRPEFIDIGGGQASALPLSIREQLGYDVSTFVEYAEAAGQAMHGAWGSDGPWLIVEPGTATLSAGMIYACSVVSTRGGDLAVSDGTIFETNPLRSRIQPPMRVLGGNRPGRTTVYGATCMEIDTFGDVDSAVEAGDVVLIENVGAYSVVLSPEFIVPRAGVIDAASGEVVRPRQEVGSFGGIA